MKTYLMLVCFLGVILHGVGEMTGVSNNPDILMICLIFAVLSVGEKS